jgi:hypothetical protein
MFETWLLGGVALAVAVAFGFAVVSVAVAVAVAVAAAVTDAVAVADPSPALRLVQQWLIDHDFGYESFEAWQDRFVESNLRRGLAGYCWEWQFLKAVFEGAFGD